MYVLTDQKMSLLRLRKKLQLRIADFGDKASSSSDDCPELVDDDCDTTGEPTLADLEASAATDETAVVTEGADEVTSTFPEEDPFDFGFGLEPLGFEQQSIRTHRKPVLEVSPLRGELASQFVRSSICSESSHMFVEVGTRLRSPNGTGEVEGTPAEVNETEGVWKNKPLNACDILQDTQEFLSGLQCKPRNVDDCMLSLSRVSARLCFLRRTQRRRRLAALKDEVNFHWSKRYFHTCWRLIHRLAGQGMGPKRRMYFEPVASPLLSEWRDYLCGPLEKGGMSCQEVSHEEELAAIQDMCRDRAGWEMPRSAADGEKVASWYSLMKDYFKRTPKRKAVPPWSAPAEIWCMCFNPGWINTSSLGPWRRTLAVGGPSR